LHVTASWCFW